MHLPSVARSHINELSPLVVRLMPLVAGDICSSVSMIMPHSSASAEVAEAVYCTIGPKTQDVQPVHKLVISLVNSGSSCPDWLRGGVYPHAIGECFRHGKELASELQSYGRDFESLIVGKSSK